MIHPNGKGEAEETWNMSTWLTWFIEGLAKEEHTASSQQQLQI